MNNHNNNFDSEIGGSLLFFLIVITLLFTANLHIPNSGQHTGYVTSVEQSGIIWKTWTAYIKTDPQSSQEDSYCVTDPKVVSDLQSAATQRSPVTVYYSVPFLTWKWQCGYEQSIIISDSVITTSPSAVQILPSTTTVSPSSPVPDSVNSDQYLTAPFARYGVTITQTGGIGSQIISATAREWDMEASSQYCTGYLWTGGECFHYLTPVENYMNVTFMSPGDTAAMGGEPDWISTGNSMWAYCKKGYTMTNAESDTNNPLDTYFMGIPNMGVAMEILDQSSNSIYIVCTKSN